MLVGDAFDPEDEAAAGALGLTAGGAEADAGAGVLNEEPAEDPPLWLLP